MSDELMPLPPGGRMTPSLIIGSSLFWAWGFLSFLSPSLIGPASTPMVHSDYAYFVSQVLLIVTVGVMIVAMHRHEITPRASFLIVIGMLLSLSTAAIAICAVQVGKPGLLMSAIGVVVGVTSPFIGIAWGARYSLEGVKAPFEIAVSFIVAYLIYFAVSFLARFQPLASASITSVLPLASALIWHREARGRQVLTEAVWPVRDDDGVPETPGELLVGDTSFALLPLRMISILTVVALIGNLLPAIMFEYRWDLTGPISYSGFLVALVLAAIASAIMFRRKQPMTLLGSLRLMLPVSSVGLVALLVFHEPAIVLSCALVFGSGLFLQLIVYVKMTEVTQRRGLSPMLTFGVGQAIVATAVIVGNVVGKVVLLLASGDAMYLLTVLAGLSVLLLIFGLVFLFRWQEPADEADELAAVDACTEKGRMADEALELRSDGCGSRNRMAEEISEVDWNLAIQVFADSLGCTKRESEVLNQLLKGRSIPYTAQQMYITTGTAKTHVNHIYQKAGVNNRQQLLNLYEETLHLK